MKVCNSEAMKKIKILEAELDRLKNEEDNNSTVSYTEAEEKQDLNYDYETYRAKINQIYADIRAIRKALSIANSTYVIKEFDMTICEALIYLAQLNNEHNQLGRLAGRHKINRRVIYNGTVEYTECLYDPNTAKEDKKAIYEKITKLQVAIDRANLNCYIEI